MRTVLVADDESEILEAFRLVFAGRSAEIRLVTAGNGREAIEVLGSEPVDLVVTDINMPILNGFQLLADVMRNYPRLPVIVTSAYGPSLARDRPRPFGPMTYREKPFDLLEIVEKIEALLEESAQGRMNGITLPSFLQLLELEGKSCSLRVSSAGRSGVLGFDRGELVDAVHGSMRGENAALEILRWEDVEIRIDATRKNRVRSIHPPLEQLIFEAAKRRDGGAPAREEGRPAFAPSEREPPRTETSRVLIESIPDGVVIEKNGLILEGNSAAAELLGDAHRQALSGRRLLEIFPPEVREEMGLYLARPAGGLAPPEPALTLLLREGAPPVEVELRARAISGSRDAGTLAIFLRKVPESTTPTR